MDIGEIIEVGEIIPEELPYESDTTEHDRGTSPEVAPETPERNPAREPVPSRKSDTVPVE